MSIDLRNICSRISVGALYPSMKVQAIDHKTISLSPDGASAPVDQPAILITMRVIDAEAAPGEDGEMTLAQCFPLPPGVSEEAKVVDWIRGRLEAVLVHELQEFLRFDGQKVAAPPHPIPD